MSLPTRPRRTAAELAEALAHRIQAGAYRAGDFLPSCRELADELSVDKNTVNKAYAILKEAGLVASSRGKGVYVTGMRESSNVHGLLRQGLENIVWQAKAAGIAEDRVWQLLGDAMWKFYGINHVDVVLVECNQPEASHMARQLERRLNFSVDTLLIDEYLSNPQPFVSSYDILTTTFHHLSAISEVAGTEQGKFVGLLGVPIVDGAIEIARARQGSRVGIVCSTVPSIETLTGLVKGYNSEIIVDVHLMQEGSNLAEFLMGFDVIVDTMSTHEHVLQLQPTAPVVTVEYEVADQSIEFLMKKVLQITRSRLEQWS
jgi:DNA-binding transcriptional regulator YhcF (GntR family)